MSGEQVLVLVLLAGAFAAGWVARGAGEDDENAEREPAPGANAGETAHGGDEMPSGGARPGGDEDPLQPAVRAYHAAMSMWLREGEQISSAGHTTLNVLDRRIDDLGEIEPGSPAEALDEAAARLEAYRRGRPLDAATLRELLVLEGRFGEFPEG